MSLHQLVANARWKFGKHPVWLSIFLSSLQLCCAQSQTRRLEWERQAEKAAACSLRRGNDGVAALLAV